ncbi:MAG: hypothetical protein JWL71_2875 [Acidobacteria bacterium]|nr:hypothetical protein [Acidobacteriota bacterium]
MRRSTPVAIEIAALLGGLTLIAIAATYPLIRHLSTRLPNDLVDPVLVAWLLAWDADAFRHGLTHLFDAPSFFPYLHTLAYTETVLGVALFTAPLQWLTANPILVYNVAFIAAFVQAGAGMYVLARALTGRRDAALLAALAYAFTPLRVAQFAHLQWLMTGWLPLSLWALHRYFSTSAFRYLLACAAAYLLQTLTGSYFAYFGLIPLVAVAIADLWRFRPPLARTVVHAIAAAVICALPLAPLVSVYAGARREHDFKRPASEIVSLSADLADYVHGHQHVALWRFGSWGNGEHELFPGAIVSVLAAVALFSWRRGSASRVWLYAAIALVTLVLSLGPQPSAWGHRSPIHGPYQLLLDVVPGLDGLRALSRMGVFVVLGLAAMAAYGAIRVIDCVSPPRRWILVALLAFGIVAEGWAAPIRTVPFDPLGLPDDRAAYTFLRNSGPDGAVLELPMSVADEAREQRYQYLTLFHRHRTINGRSGYAPALTQWLYSDQLSPLADLDHLDVGIDLLRAIGVRYIVIHRGAIDRAAADTAMMRVLDGDGGRVAAKHAFGQTVVFTLTDAPAPAPEPGWRTVPASAMHARASHSPDRLPLLFDRDRDTRWLTGGRQTGDEWIELEFDAPHRVAAVRMQTAERSFEDYPRQLAIDVVEDAGSRTVFQGSVLPSFGHGFAVNHTYPTIEIRLADNRARRLRLRQLGATGTMFWSIHELEVLER